MQGLRPAKRAAVQRSPHFLRSNDTPEQRDRLKNRQRADWTTPEITQIFLQHKGDVAPPAGVSVYEQL